MDSSGMDAASSSSPHGQSSSRPMDAKLYQAIASGDLESFKAMVIQRWDSLSQVTGIEKNTVLHLAAKFKKEEIVRFIINSEPSLKYKGNKNDDTPLHLAARTGSTKIGGILVNETAQARDAEAGQSLVRMANKQKDTALHDALRGGHLQVVMMLLQKDTGLALVLNEAGESPLFLALERKFEQIARYIIETAPECSYEGSCGMNALHLAAFLGFNDILNIMVARFPRESLDKQCDNVCWTPLHYAAHHDNSEAVDILMGRNTGLGYLGDDCGMTPLHVAAASGSFKVVMKFEEICPDAFEQTDSIGRTALHFAVLTNKMKVVKYIVKTAGLGDLANIADNKGNTPLHYAAMLFRILIFLKLKNHNESVGGVLNHKGLSPNDISTRNYKFNGLFVRTFRHIFVRLALSSSNEMKICLPSASKTAVKRALSFKNRVKDQPYISINGASARPDQIEFAAHGSNTVAKYKQKKERREIFAKARDVNIVMYTLIAAATFGAALQVPGGYDEDGYPVLRDRAAFKVFLCADMVAFFCSLISIVFLFFATYVDAYGGFLLKCTDKFNIPRVPQLGGYLTISATTITFLAAMFLIKMNVEAMTTFCCCLLLTAWYCRAIL